MKNQTLLTQTVSKLFFLPLTILLCWMLVVLPVQAGIVKDVRVWRSPDKTRLVFDLSSGVKQKVFSLDNPHRLVVDLDGTEFKASTKGLTLQNTPVKKVRWGVRNGKDTRVVLDLRTAVRAESFLLRPNEAYGHRLVIDLFDRQPKKKPVKKAKSASPKGREVVIAIDAGHGGEDPGAIGYKGVKEKNVTLSIARELAKKINHEPGFRAVLVRTGDYYIGLRKRTQLARQAKADLFVSIHADAFKNKQANGASIFALSNRGASSETARWLAKKENSSDLIGGEGGLSLGDKDNVLAEVLLDLSMTSTMSASFELGDMVLKNIGQFNRLHKKRVEQAAFVVLKSPDIPSLLIETGFITNPGEAKKLSNRRHRDKMAAAIYAGVRDYFKDRPPPDSWLAWAKGQRLAGKPVGTPPGMRQYTVKAGDTLSGIALRYNMSTSRLAKANNMRLADPIRTGQKLRVP